MQNIDENILTSNSAAIHVLIPCGGTGSRAMDTQRNAAHVPKQYQLINGKPMLWHTLQAFVPLLDSGVIASLQVVIAKDDTHYSKYSWVCVNKRLNAIPMAGITRAQTVMNGLQHLLNANIAQTQDWVLVHDAARCLISSDAVLRLIQACSHDVDNTGGLLAQPLADTLKVADDAARVQATLQRDDKWLAQTPQMFRMRPLLDALLAAGDAVTDEASAMEQAGVKPLLVKSDASNFKVTYAEDFSLAEAILKGRMT